MWPGSRTTALKCAMGSQSKGEHPVKQESGKRGGSFYMHIRGGVSRVGFYVLCGWTDGPAPCKGHKKQLLSGLVKT